MTDDAKPSPPTPPAPGPIERLNRLVRLLAILCGIWLFMAFVVPNLMYSPPSRQQPEHDNAPPRAPTPKDDVLLQRLDDLEARLKALEETPVVAVTKDDDALEHANDERLAQLEATVAQLQEQRRADANQLAAVTAFSQMKDAVMRGNAFLDTWDRLHLLAKERREAQAPLQTLAPLAGTGIMTLAELRTGFEAAIPQALSPHQGKDRLADALQSLVRIRKVGEQQQGADDESVIARAEAKLQRGELEKVLAELEHLSPAASRAFKDWTRSTREHLDAHAAVEALQVALLQPEPADPDQP